MFDLYPSNRSPIDINLIEIRSVCFQPSKLPTLWGSIESLQCKMLGLWTRYTYVKTCRMPWQRLETFPKPLSHKPPSLND